MFYAQDKLSKKREEKIMENASDALKMAGAVLIFIIALTIVFSLISQIKTTSDSVLFNSDKLNYYTWETGTLDKRKNSWRGYYCCNAL